MQRGCCLLCSCRCGICAKSARSMVIGVTSAFFSLSIIGFKAAQGSLDMMDRIKKFEEGHDLQSDLETIVIVTVVVGVMGFATSIL